MSQSMTSRVGWLAILMSTAIACDEPDATPSPSPELEPTPTASQVPDVSPTETAPPETSNTPEPQATPVSGERPEGWTEPTHGKDAEPDYDTVFPSDKVNRLDITIAPEDWASMVSELSQQLGEFGSGSSTPGGNPGEPPPLETAPCEGLSQGDTCVTTLQGVTQSGECSQDPRGGALVCMPIASEAAIEACQDKSESSSCTYSDGESTVSGLCSVLPGQPLACMSTGGGGQPDAGMDFASDISFVPSTLIFEGIPWNHVGIRFKGNSSLASPWASGVWKLPFKLDFDEFEDEFPSIEDQRFYSFKHLSLSNGWADDSLIHEKVMDDLFRLAGIPAPRAAFYQLYLDIGDGPVYFGLYTLVENIESDMLETQLGTSNGNLYKPEGSAAAWTYFDAACFEKETNEDEADYSDIEAAIDALLADRSDLGDWRAGLEETFNVSAFAQWLAFNTLAVNWDTYGQMAHNYYLYGDPEDDGRLRWLPWDNSFALTTTAGFGNVLSLELEEVSDEWPLIRYLMDDPSFEAEYRSFIASSVSGAFEANAVKAQLESAHTLIAPYVTGLNGETAPYTNLSSASAFESSLSVLYDHVDERHRLAATYLED